MEKEIKSKALEVNLAQTREVNIIIPEDHLWFLSVAENHYGIHKRIKDFFTEFHHPYSNKKYVVEQLNNIAIGDYWLYQGHPKNNKAFFILLDIFDNLLEDELNQELSKQVVYIFLKFFDNNYENISGNKELIKKILLTLEKHLENRYFSYISNLGFFFKCFSKAAQNKKLEKDVFDFTYKLVYKNISFWEKTTNVEKWHKENKVKLSGKYLDTLKKLGKPFFEHHYKQLDAAKSWNDIVNNAFTFSDMVTAFRNKTDEFDNITEKFSYLFYLLHLPGMAYHRSYLLLDLNKVIKKISSELNEEQIRQSIDELFELFSEFKNNYIDMVLDSVLTLGKEIINTSNISLIHYFEDKLIKLGFTTPGIKYLTNEWQIKVNRSHIKNIRVWLDLIEHGPEMMQKLLSALIINLRLGGIFIFDTDLFQRDVSKLLNAEISTIYKQVKQLTRIFPVYFSEIGAEGELRDVTTIIDEISQRNDKLIHFLRKQVHTEGNNSHIQITLDIIRFWYDLDKKRLKQLIPENVFNTIDINSKWVQGVHTLINKVCSQNKISLNKLLELSEEEVKNLLEKSNHKSKNDIKRIKLIIKLYQLLKEKYSFETDDITKIIGRYRFFSLKETEALKNLLESKSDIDALKAIFSFMVRLNEVIFNPAKSKGWENIYYKRHVAFGIPSMYGEYHEPKFEALGLTFRLERVANVLVDRIISNINTDFLTAKTLKEIYSVIKLLREGLELDGISDQGLNSNLQMLQYSLTSGSFTIKQYINIFQFMEDSVKEIINKYFIRPYEDLLKVITPQLFSSEAKPDSKTGKKFIHKKSEIFYRDLLFSTFLIQQLDNFIGEVLNNLRKMDSELSTEDIRNIMSYDPGMVISPIYSETPTMDNQIFLGSKAYYLKNLYINKYPVPPGFVLTTEVFRRKNTILKQAALNAEIDNFIRKHITELENLSGREFGNPLNPLLLSVRSGAAISMPGAMNTFLNVGLNDEITEMLSKQYNFGWTSWDCYRRLIQTWGMSFGIDRNDFDQVMIDYKKKYNVTQKIDFPPEIMKKMAFTYKKLLADNGIYFESDPFMQLKQSIISVFNSWDTPRTKVYRDHMHIADEWGTAVIVQQMVFGNIHNESGSGVLFTHDPSDNISGINLNGDFSFLSQGEDIVAGLINTLPVSEYQREKYYTKSPFSLESAFPKIYNRLKEIAFELIESHGFSHQEIEFTFETAEEKDLYILQTRDMAIIKQDKIVVFATPESKMERAGCGIGIGNEVLNGLVVFDMDDIYALKEKHPESKAVLIRPDTVPDDIEMIFECDGLLTAKGGATSHAAVTAATLGKICVVNCPDMVVDENSKKCEINGVAFKSFDPVAIDGTQGIIYKGNYPVKTHEL